jgi:CDP-diacylglycerol--glycerol-3-phosphate 3-phosphatidyltransferase
VLKANLANIFTIARIVLTPVFLYLLYENTMVGYLMALIVFIIASVSDYADGAIARKLNQQSEFGKFMDPLADKVLVMSTFFVFALMDFAPDWMVALVILRDLFITLIRSVMSRRGKSMSTSNIAKVKTAIQMVFIYTVLAWLLLMKLPFLKVIHPALQLFRDYHGFWVLMLITTFLTLYTGILYFFENKHIFRKAQ